MTGLARHTEVGSATNPDPFIVAEGPEALSAIHQSGCAAVIWQRTLLDDFQSWIDTLNPEQLPTGRLILQAEAVPSALLQLCEIAGTPASPMRDLLINDIVILAELFCETMHTDYLRLRLDKISGNACSRFHKDALTARLVCTYRGTGTQYGFSEANQEPDPVHTAPVGCPIVMRGTLWPETPASGFVHRSPPIEGLGESRLLLVLDPISNPAEEV